MHICVQSYRFIRFDSTTITVVYSLNMCREFKYSDNIWSIVVHSRVIANSEFALQFPDYHDFCVIQKCVIQNKRKIFRFNSPFYQKIEYALHNRKNTQTKSKYHSNIPLIRSKNFYKKFLSVLVTFVKNFYKCL